MADTLTLYPRSCILSSTLYPQSQRSEPESNGPLLLFRQALIRLSYPTQYRRLFRSVAAAIAMETMGLEPIRRVCRTRMPPTTSSPQVQVGVPRVELGLSCSQGRRLSIKP